MSRPHPNDEDATLDAVASAQLRELEARITWNKALHEMLASARPRLLRLARLQGVPAEMVEDVVQESLLAAWHSLNHLRHLDRFDAWLDAICRNISHQHRRTNQLQAQRQVSLNSIAPSSSSSDRTGGDELFDPLDPQTCDPAEELDRQDLQTLLDRALGYLSPGAREAVELYYLLDMPQREAALRLGLSIRGLEDRLARARLQLRQILSHDLREEAQACGLAFHMDDTRCWRQSRIWCVLCGKRRLRGLFEVSPDGTSRLRLRCEDCSQKYQDDIFSAEKITLTRGLRSFLPVIKQMVQTEKTYFAHALEKGWQNCRHCGAKSSLQIMDSEEMNLCPLPERIWLVLRCPACQHTTTSSATSVVCWTDALAAPLAQRFMTEHPRWIAAPATSTIYANQPAIRMHLESLTSETRLTIFAHARTLQALYCFRE